jgi:hypothetical protein
LTAGDTTAPHWTSVTRARLFAIAGQDDDLARTSPHNEGRQTRRPDCTGADDPYLHFAAPSEALIPRERTPNVAEASKNPPDQR